uniref:Uncharacterized protein n=1 Tax=Arundo donax TaxID=35708 RepID=A0A0A8ZSY9_ARUDO
MTLARGRRRRRGQAGRRRRAPRLRRGRATVEQLGSRSVRHGSGKGPAGCTAAVQRSSTPSDPGEK